MHASRGKKNDFKVFETWYFAGEYTEKYRKIIENFPIHKHKPIQIYDGISRKVRQIIVPSYQEQVVHHCLVNILEPIIWKGLYKYSCGSIPNKGVHYGANYFKRCIKNDKENTKYCLKMDVRKFFDSIDHDVLKARIEKTIKDKKFLHVLYQVIDINDKGLPLGFYTSQWLANFFLSDLDHYIKEQLHAKYYVRYMDDMVIFGHDKTELHEMRKAIDNYLHDLHLQMKDNWQVFLFDDGEGHGRYLDFMGFKFYRNRTVLRKSIMIKACRKAKKIGKKEKPTVYDCRQIISYFGWLDWTNSYNLYAQRIESNVRFRYCRYRVSKYDRRMAEWEEKRNVYRVYQLFVNRGAPEIGRQVLNEYSLRKKKHYRKRRRTK